MGRWKKQFRIKSLTSITFCATIYSKNVLEDNMAVSYKKLWKLLIDKDLKKKDLELLAGVSHYTLNKLNKGENVTTDILGRICKALNCNIDDVMEFVEDEKND